MVQTSDNIVTGFFCETCNAQTPPREVYGESGECTVCKTKGIFIVKEWCCPKCNEVKPIAAFFSGGSRLPLQYRWCRFCTSIHAGEWKEFHQKAYQAHNRKKLNEYSRARLLANRHKSWAYATIKSHELRGYQILFSIDELAQRAIQTTNCRYCDVLLSWNTLKSNNPDAPSLDRAENSKTLSMENTQIVC